MQELFSFVIRFALHLVVVYGCWLLLKPLLNEWLVRKSKDAAFILSLKLKNIGTRLVKKRSKSTLYKHFDTLLYLVRKDYEPGVTVFKFITLLIFLFISTFIVSFVLIGEVPSQITFENPFKPTAQEVNAPGRIIWQFPFLTASIITLIPYIVLRYSYSNKSVQSTYDLLEVVKLLSKYSELSMDAALEKTSKLLPEHNVLKRPLRILSLTFANYSNQQELVNEMNRFSGVIGSTFADNISINLIYLQHQGGAYLKEYLVGLYQDMVEQRSNIIKVKETTRDAISLGTYGNLLVFGLCITALILILGMHVYIKLQFQTTIGLTFFFIIIGSFVVSSIIAALLSKPRLDYH